MKNEALKMVFEHKDLMFTFKSEAEQFAKQNKLEYEYNDGEFIDNEHFIIKGYGSKLYWIAN